MILERVIRAAVPGDVPTLAAFKQAMAWETEHKKLADSTILEGVTRGVLSDGAARYFVCEMDGNIVGQLMVTREWSDWRNGDFWWIQSVYVLPEYRGQGIFKSLYRHVETLARADGNVCGLRLYVERENNRAQDVYRKLGMVDAQYAVYEMDWSKKRDGASQA